MNMVALGEVVTIRGGGTPDKSVPAYWNGNIPWASVKDFKDTALTNTIDRITEAGVAASATQIIPAGNIIVPTRMAVGKAAINTIDLAINQDLKALIPSDDLDRRYLLHALLANAQKLEDQATGATVKGIKLDALRSLQIPLPPVPEQKRIAGILDQADALRRLRARALEKLSTLGQAIFQEMFGEVLDSHDTVHLGEATSKIGSGATPRGGDAAYKSEGIPLIRSMNVRDGTFSTKGLAFIDADQAGKLNNVAVKAKDILLNITGASVARVCIAPEDMNGARVNQHVAIIRCTSNLLPEFLEAFLLLPRIKAKLLNIAEGGATRQAITKAQIQDLEVPRTGLSEQKAFVERRRAVTAQQGYMLHQASTAESLFASLQHRAFRGEL